MISTSDTVVRPRLLSARNLRQLSLGWLNLPGIAFLVVVAVLWQIAMSMHLVNLRYLPTPLHIISATSGLAQSGALARNFGHTLYVSLLGWSAATALGIAVGLVLGLSVTTWRFSMASIEFLRALPAIAFVPVAILLLGFSVKMELVVIVYVSVWPILIGTIHGAREVTALHRDVAKMMHMSWLAKVTRLVLPTTAPFIFVGMQISLSLALALALVAEMVGNPTGVGQALIVAQNTFHPAQMFAYVILIGIVGVILNAVFLRFVATAFRGTFLARRAQA